VDLWRGGERGVRGEEKIGRVGGYKNFFFPFAECPGSGHSAKFLFFIFSFFLFRKNIFLLCRVS